MLGLVLIAAGYGSFRVNDGRRVPKVLERVRGQPLLIHPLMVADAIGLPEAILVVNPMDRRDIQVAIEAAFRDNAIKRFPRIVVQQFRHGAADAVHCALGAARQMGMTRALIMYGDMPEWSVETVQALIAWDSEHPGTPVTMVTIQRDLNDSSLASYGRIVRNTSIGIERVVEVSDREITEDIQRGVFVNPSLWIWDVRWLEKHIPLIEPVEHPDGMGHELYMPRLVELVSKSGASVTEYRLSQSKNHEARGVNTLEELRILET